MKVDEQKMWEWLHECERTNCTHMLVVLDRSEGEFDIFPVKVSTKQNVTQEVTFYNSQTGCTVIEIYNMSLPLNKQLAEQAAYNL